MSGRTEGPLLGFEALENLMQSSSLGSSLKVGGLCFYHRAEGSWQACLRLAKGVQALCPMRFLAGAFLRRPDLCVGHAGRGGSTLPCGPEKRQS